MFCEVCKLKFSDSKSDLQDHSRSLALWYSTANIELPIRVPMQLHLYLALFPRYYWL